MSGTNFPPGQENINTVVMMTNASRVVKAADRRNGITVFFQRFEGTREFVVRTGLGDLVIERVDSIGKIEALLLVVETFSAALSGVMHSSIGSAIQVPIARRACRRLINQDCDK